MNNVNNISDNEIVSLIKSNPKESIKEFIENSFTNVIVLTYRDIHRENGVLMVNLRNTNITMHILIGNGWNNKSEIVVLLNKLNETFTYLSREVENRFYSPIIIVRELQIYFYRKYSL